MGAQFGGRVGGIRRRIGLVLDAFDSSYQSTFVNHLRQRCDKSRLELVVIPGGIIGGTERAARHRNPLYDIVGGGPLDGVIILGSTLSPAVGPEGLSQFCHSFAPLPVCCVGAHVPGIPSVCVDNAAGMKTLLLHMITEHQARDIAFVRGPEGNEEAEARYQAYLEALRNNDITPNGDLVVCGDFLFESGKTAVQTLLDDRGVRFDAVVAANDYMALGAMGALAVHPRSPSSTAVVGFDNVDEAHFTAPALTTVEQPFDEMAEAAIRAIVCQLQGDTPEALTVFDAKLLVRRSCGCTGAGNSKRSDVPLAASTDYEVNFGRRREQITAELSRAAAGHITGIRGWEERLLDGFLAQLRGIPGSAFFCALDVMLGAIEQAGGEIWRMHAVLNELRRQALACIVDDHQAERMAETVLQDARTVVGDAVARSQAQQRLRNQQMDRALNDCGTRLAETESSEALKRCLSRELTRLGAQRAYVMVYDGNGVCGASRLFFSLDPADQYQDSAKRPFATTELIPEALWLGGKAVNWVLLPLFFRGHNLGYLMIDLAFPNGSYFETLRTHLSVGLWSALFGPSLAEVGRSGTTRVSGSVRVYSPFRATMKPAAS